MEYYDFVDLSFRVGGLVGHPSVVGKFPHTHTPQREQVEFFDFGQRLVTRTDGTLLGRLGFLYKEWVWCPAPAAQWIHQKFWIPDTEGGALRTPWVSQEGWVCCAALLLGFHGTAWPGDQR